MKFMTKILLGVITVLSMMTIGSAANYSHGDAPGVTEEDKSMAKDAVNNLMSGLKDFSNALEIMKKKRTPKSVLRVKVAALNLLPLKTYCDLLQTQDLPLSDTARKNFKTVCVIADMAKAIVDTNGSSYKDIMGAIDSVKSFKKAKGNVAATECLKGTDSDQVAKSCLLAAGEETLALKNSSGAITAEHQRKMLKYMKRGCDVGKSWTMCGFVALTYSGIRSNRKYFSAISKDKQMADKYFEAFWRYAKADNGEPLDPSTLTNVDKKTMATFSKSMYEYESARYEDFMREALGLLKKGDKKAAKKPVEKMKKAEKLEYEAVKMYCELTGSAAYCAIKRGMDEAKRKIEH